MNIMFNMILKIVHYLGFCTEFLNSEEIIIRCRIFKF